MKILVTLIILFLNINFVIAADSSARWIDLEWDSVEGAAAYEISLSEIIDSVEAPRGVFSTDTASWSKEVNPGNYSVRIRTLDARKVPGAWGDPIPVVINQEDPQPLVPLDNEEILKNETGKTKITFQWAKVYGTQEYTIRVFDNKGSELISKKTNETEMTLELDDINDYFWLVTSGSGTQIQTPALSELKRKFSIRGEKLKAPLIEVNSNHPKGVYFKWSEVYRALEYEVSITRISESQNELIKKFITKKPLFGIGTNLIPQGKWVFAVVAKSNLYKNSEVSRIIFTTEGKKNIVMTNESVVKETNYRDSRASTISINFSNPTLNYSNINYETDTSNDQSLLGMQFSLNHSLNFADSLNLNSLLTIGQFSDSLIDVMNYNFSTGVRKAWEIKLLKIQTGLSLGLRSTPILIPNRLSQPNLTKNILMILYPEFNFQVNYNITENFEIEFLTKLDMNFKNLKSSDCGELEKSLNKLIGFRTSYNVNNKFNFSIGINLLDISNRTYAKTGSNSFAISGDINESIFNANYIDFGVKYFY